MNAIKRKIASIRLCIQYGWWDKIIAGFLGKRISLWSNTLKPQRYRYIMLASHGTGRNAFWHFMDIANAYPMRKFDIASIDRTCFFSYRKFYGIVCDRDINYCNGGLEFISKLNKKVPVFCLVRDPISIIRGGANMMLADNIVNGMIGGGNKALIKNTLLSYLESYYNMPHHFIFTTSPNQFKHITKELIYIDMSDISEQNAYDTIKKCCSKIGINKIAVDKEFFTRKIADSLSLNIEKDFDIDISGRIFNIKILPFENTLHKRFKIINIIDDTNLKRKIAICLLGKKYKKLKQINQEAKDYINSHTTQYLKDLSDKFKIYEQSKINENDVLEYFKNDQTLHKKFKKLLDYEVSNVQKYSPKIAESWVYYKEFQSYHL